MNRQQPSIAAEPRATTEPPAPRHLTLRLDAAIRELRSAAMEADDTIKGIWVGYTDDDISGIFLLNSVTFDRSGKALAVAQARAAKS